VLFSLCAAAVTGCGGTQAASPPGLQMGPQSPGASGGAGIGGSTSTTTKTRGPKPPSVPSSAAKLLGQRVMVGLPGLSASSTLLGRIKRGEVGSVILFSYNVSTRTQVKALTASLQNAAKAGGNPPLLIAIDQEGGQVKRLTAGPPSLSPPQMVAAGGTSVATSQGRATGRYLRGLGINMDLAPVLDVPTFSGAFIWQQGRAFAFSPQTVASYGGAFAFGLQSAKVAATGKHFPGDGTAGKDTDVKLDLLTPTAAQRAGALVPYRGLIPKGLDAVMVTTARFPAYDASKAPAALSKPIIQGLLRGQLKFNGVAITDALGAPTGHSETTAGVLAAEAGADILLYTDSAASTLSALETEMKHGRLSHAAAVASYRRIVALKQRLR
jgi:beta-N-acetylhexosaminidase